MKIKKRSLFGFLYCLNFDVLSINPLPTDTNLCHFIRVVLIWLPLKLLSLASVVGVAIVWWVVSLSVIGLFLAVMSILFLIFFFVSRDYTNVQNLYLGLVRSPLVEYIKAKKQRICPLVEIVEK